MRLILRAVTGTGGCIFVKNIALLCRGISGFLVLTDEWERFIMEKGRVDVSNVIKFAGTFIAFLIGSGFATGQEILQYFTSYGLNGVLTGLLMLVLFIYVGASFISAGFSEDFKKGSDIFGYYCG